MIAYRLVEEAKSALPENAEVDVLWNQVSVEEGERETVRGHDDIESGYATQFEKTDFYIDSYEVTNAEFMGFVRAGGYQSLDYWKHEFVREGETIS